MSTSTWTSPTTAALDGPLPTSLKIQFDLDDVNLNSHHRGRGVKRRTPEELGPPVHTDDLDKRLLNLNTMLNWQPVGGRSIPVRNRAQSVQYTLDAARHTSQPTHAQDYGAIQRKRSRTVGTSSPFSTTKDLGQLDYITGSDLSSEQLPFSNPDDAEAQLNLDIASLRGADTADASTSFEDIDSVPAPDFHRPLAQQRVAVDAQTAYAAMKMAFLERCNPCVRTDLQALTLSNRKPSRRLVEQRMFASAVDEKPTSRYVIRLDRGHAAVFSVFIPDTINRRYFENNVREVVFTPFIHYSTEVVRERRIWNKTTMKPGMRWSVVNAARTTPLLERAPDKNAKDVPEWVDEQLRAERQHGYAVAARFFNPLREEGIVCREPTPMFFSASAVVYLSVESEIRRKAIRRIGYAAKMHQFTMADWTGSLLRSILIVEAEFMRSTRVTKAVAEAAEVLAPPTRQWFESSVVGLMLAASCVHLPEAVTSPIAVAGAPTPQEGASGPLASTCVFFGRAHLNRRPNSPNHAGKTGVTRAVWQWVPGTTCMCGSTNCSRQVFVGNREKAAEAALNNRALEWFT